MKEYFVKIKWDSMTPEILGVENPGLQFYYKAIDCSCIQIVRPWREQCMIVDEEFLLKHEPQLNIIASILANENICGNVLICKEGVRNGEPDLIGFTMPEAFASVMAINQIVRACEG